MFLMKLAIKNLSRHKLRTFVSLIAIAFSVMIVVFARGYILGMVKSFTSHGIEYDSGHVKIVDKDYWQQRRTLPLNYTVDGFHKEGIDNMITKIEEQKYVKAAIPRLTFGGMISTEEELFTILGWGVDPQKEMDNTSIGDYIAEGRMVENGRREVVMGAILLDKLGKKVGDKVTIVYNTSFNSLKGTTFEIVGRVESGLRMLNEMIVYMPLDLAQTLLYMDGQATEILVMADNIGLTGKVMPEMKSLFEKEGSTDKYEVLSYKESSELLPWMELATTIYNEIYVFIILLASIVVINTMIMIVKERTREIGMMAALGLESKDILRLFIMEGGVMGVIGSFFGALIGTLMSLYFAVNGIDLTSSVEGFSETIVFSSIIYPSISIENAVFAFILGSLLVTLACIIPARQAAKLQPTDAIRDA